MTVNRLVKNPKLNISARDLALQALADLNAKQKKAREEAAKAKK
jgi:hypothetical protein